ncbi:MAG: hypothetical protein M9904_18455 [Chitinophagaceae bacterium]|nr:hypothetical protein [Chitinophagaceae bacterium]
MKEFYLKIKEDQSSSLLIKHIQYNVAKRVVNLKYSKYRRVDIIFDWQHDDVDIDWNDIKTARIICGISCEIIPFLREENIIKEVYAAIYKCLTKLWDSNGWNFDEINNIFADIAKENYKSWFIYGKTLLSPDRQLKACFFCDLYPSFANYHVQILNKKNELIKNILFLKGQPDLLIFFLFFKNYYWVDSANFILCDINKEIFYVFNIIGGVSVEYKPLYNSVEDCKNYIKAFEYDTTISDRLKLLNIV